MLACFFIVAFNYVYFIMSELLDMKLKLQNGQLFIKSFSVFF